MTNAQSSVREQANRTTDKAQHKLTTAVHTVTDKAHAVADKARDLANRPEVTNKLQSLKTSARQTRSNPLAMIAVLSTLTLALIRAIRSIIKARRQPSNRFVRAVRGATRELRRS